MQNERSTSETDAGATSPSKEVAKAIDGPTPGTSEMRKLRDGYENRSGDGTISTTNPTGSSNTLFNPNFNADESAPIVGWLTRGLAGLLNMLDSATRDGRAMYPHHVEEIRKCSQRLLEIYARELHKVQ